MTSQSCVAFSIPNSSASKVLTIAKENEGIRVSALSPQPPLRPKYEDYVFKFTTSEQLNSFLCASYAALGNEFLVQEIERSLTEQKFAQIYYRKMNAIIWHRLTMHVDPAMITDVMEMINATNACRAEKHHISTDYLVMADFNSDVELNKFLRKAFQKFGKQFSVHLIYAIA